MMSYRRNFRSTPIQDVKEQRKRVLLLMPTYKWIPTETFSSFYHLVWYLLNNYTLEMQFVENTLVTEARNNLFAKALELHEKKPFDYILWCDSDHIFKPEDFKKLVDTMEEYGKDIASALYFTRRVDKVTPVAYIQNEERLYYPIGEIPENSFLKVDAVGLGMCLMRPKVFIDINKKWKRPFVEGNDHRFVGEDMLFFEHANECGYKPYVHTGAIVRHYGGSIGLEEYNMYGLKGE